MKATGKKIRYSTGDRIFDIIVLLVMLIVLLICLYPLYFIMIASISDPYLVSAGKVFLIPKGISFNAYERIFAYKKIWSGYLNTFIYTGVGTTINVVITVAAGFPTTVACIVQFGAVPVFVDMNIEESNLDTTQLEAALSPKTKAVMVAHSLGNPFNLEAVVAFCKKHNLWLVEDNCDALGSEYFIDGEWKKTGTIGDIGTSSFYPPHHMTMGEGGAVYTNNHELDKYVKSFRDWGRDCWCVGGVDNTCGCRFTGQFGKLPQGYDHKYVYSHLGYNLKATDMQAAIGCAQLEKLDFIVSRRRENYQTMYDGLKGTPGLLLPEPQKNSKPSWFGFFVTVKEDAGYTRNELTSYLEEHQVQTRNLFAGNLLMHPAFEEYVEGKDYRTVGDLPVTTSIMKNCFWLGVYPGMTPEKLQYMIKTIKDFVASKTK